MLKYLFLKDFLFIKEQELEFHAGLNVITGESGSGKSLLISSLNFLLGDSGEYPDDTTVEALFVIDGEDVFIRREVRGGKSQYYLDGRRASSKAIKELIGEHIVFQGQNDRYRILRSDFQRDVFDKFANTLELRKIFQDLYTELEDLKKKLSNYYERQREINIRKALLKQELEEIHGLNLDLQGYVEIKERLEILSKREKYNQLLLQLLDILSGNVGIVALLNDARKIVEEVSSMDARFSKWHEELKRIKELLTELDMDCRRNILDVSPEEIDRLNALMFEVQKLERKYRRKFEDLLKYAQHIKEELELLESSSVSLEEIEEKVKDLEKKIEEVGQELSRRRREAARSFEERIKETLRKLGLERSSLRVEFQPSDGKFGKENIKFLFSSFGYDEKPLDDVASGGEISRIALSLYLLSPPTGLYVMDEVDVGLSGQSARELTRLLKELSKNTQIIAITHSSVLASAGDKHYLAYKSYAHNGHLLHIREISGEERLREIARLMGKVSQRTLEGAKELLQEFSHV